MKGIYPRTTTLKHGITAIDTEYVRPLLDASHLLIENGKAAFIHVGTNHTVPQLMATLENHDIHPADVDFLFLTHVHLDHAGGAGLMMQELPNAKAVIHPRGAPHMVDPTKLIKGTQSVYGAEKFAELYGKIIPIPEDKIIIVDDQSEINFAGRILQIFFTEGHARHHYCLYDSVSNGVFTGDSFGVSYRELDTSAGEFIFPTTTPVQFDPYEAHKAIDTIMSFSPNKLYLTHYSQVTNLPRLADDMHTRIDDFVDIILACSNHKDRTKKIHTKMQKYFLTELKDHGCKLNSEVLYDLLQPDVVLNTMGLEFWLDHEKGKNAYG